MPVFIPQNDEEYQKWVRNNLVGFVINTNKTPTSKYMVLHTHSCRTINELASFAGDDAFTKNGYTKICSDSIQGLQDWMGEQGFSFSKECQKCNPRNNFFLSEDAAKRLMSDFNKEKGKDYPRDKLLKSRDFIISQIRKGILPEAAFNSILKID